VRERLIALAQALKLPDVRRRLVFVMLMFAVYTFCAFVPLPGIDRAALSNFFRSQGGGLLGLFNAFSGGSLRRFSILALGIMPYINASIIFQLLAIAVPQIEELQKEGEYGRKKIAQWTKYLTVALAMLQAAGMLSMFASGAGVQMGIWGRLFAMVMMTSGTMFLMWLGEKITDKGIGQGVSLIIFAGIVLALPGYIRDTTNQYRAGDIGLQNVIFLALIFLAMVYGIVMVQQAQRKIPVQYAKRVKGHRVYGGSSQFLPLRVNQAGVIPIIFAISVMLFPATILQMLQAEKVASFLSQTLHLNPDIVSTIIFSVRKWSTPGQSTTASLLYFIMVVLFTYFYTAVTFNPEQISDDLRKNGGSIPGIRPGERTRDHLDRILMRITLAGAIFLGIVALTQYYVGDITGVTTFNLVGGTSLLIVVGVALDTMQQVEAQLLMRRYRGFLD